jgi:uncharacterized membrane protein
MFNAAQTGYRRFTMTRYTATYYQSQYEQRSQPITAASPFQWLRYAWQDLAATPLVSLSLGVMFSVACALAYLAASALPQFSAAFLVLMLMVGPFIAAAAYCVVRNRELEERPSLRACLAMLRSRSASIALFSLLCALLVAAWVRLTGITFALYYGTLAASSAEVARVWTAGDGAPAMLVFLLTASVVLALALFALGAIALPLIADQNCNVVDAVRIGLRTLRRNAVTMLVWMMLLVVAIGIALASGLILMPLVFPLLAYATWHSYRQLVDA